LIVDDVNDNLPEIFFPEKMQVISIMEETFATLFTATELVVNDIDLLRHATYEIVLTQKDTSLVEYSKAFNIVPNNGYQEQGFTLSVANIDLIDYENEIWREFDIIVSLIQIRLNLFLISTLHRLKLPK
jgi:aspartyl/asparaginyl-tRNA synthetase